MAETVINKNQQGEGVWTQDTLVSGTGISITKVQEQFDANTLAVYHLDDSKANAVSGSTYGNVPAIGTFSTSGAKWNKGFVWSSGEFFINNQSSGLGTGDFTVDFWLCPTATSSNWQIIRVVNFLYTSSDNGFAFNVSDNTITVQPYIGGSRVTSSGEVTLANDGTPHHFAIEHASNNFNLYVDASLIYTHNASSLNYDRFGLAQTSWASTTIDEIRLSNVARYNGESTIVLPTHPYGYVEKDIFQIDNTQDLSSYLQNTATGTGSLTILGTANTNTGAINIGTGSASSNSSIAIGYNASTNGTGRISIGYNASTTNGGYIAIGGATTASEAASASSTATIAIGYKAKASGLASLAIGAQYSSWSAPTASGQGSIALGCAQATQSDAVAIGRDAKATATSAIQIGNGTNSTASTCQIFSTQVINASGKIPMASTDITSLTGYDAAKTQVLKNVNGTLTWVDDAWTYNSNTEGITIS